MNLNVGKPVTGEELIGRENEVKEIIRTIKAGQSVALIAPRRFGKTSIMLDVLSRLSKEYYTGHVDLFTIPDIPWLAYEITSQVLKNRKLDESLHKLKQNIGEILTNIKFRNEIEGAEFILSFGKPEKNSWELLNSSLKYIDAFALKHKRSICFGFDEFGDIEKLDGSNIIKLFRGVIQSQKQSAFIFSGSYESVMSRLFVTSKSPFYRMVKIIQPGYIDKVSTQNFIKKKFDSLQIRADEKLISRGTEFTGGHPYYIRLFIQEFYFRYLEFNKNPDLEDVFEAMLISENNYLEKLWEEISRKKETKLVFIKIAETGKPYSAIMDKSINISRAIKDLAGKGIIFSSAAGYYISDPMLVEFVNRRVLKLKTWA